MISQFPSFSPMHVEDKDIVREMTSEYEPYSDFNAVSLFAWGAEIASLNGNLVVKLPGYTGDATTYSILGSNKIEASLGELRTVTNVLNFVPEVVIGQFANESYVVQEEPENDDYVYSVEDLKNLSGQCYKKKRNLNNRIMSMLGDRLKVVVSTDLDDDGVDAVLLQWAQQKNKTDIEIEREFTALHRLLHSIEELDLIIVRLYVDDKLQAFSINEIAKEKYAICHFEKTLDEYPELATHLVYVVANELWSHGCQKVNWEQDLGISGLRQAKRSYKPIEMLKKYTVAL